MWNLRYRGFTLNYIQFSITWSVGSSRPCVVQGSTNCNYYAKEAYFGVEFSATVSGLLTSGGQSIGASASTSVLPTNISMRLVFIYLFIFTQWNMEYNSTIKRNRIGSFVEMWMDLQSVTQKKKQILYVNSYM